MLPNKYENMHTPKSYRSLSSPYINRHRVQVVVGGGTVEVAVADGREGRDDPVEGGEVEGVVVGVGEEDLAGDDPAGGFAAQVYPGAGEDVQEDYQRYKKLDQSFDSGQRGLAYAEHGLDQLGVCILSLLCGIGS
jgi:hypothetical protein